MLNQTNLKDVEFFLGEPKEGVRTGLVSMLRNMGLRNISAYDTAEKLTSALMSRPPDVLVVASDLHDEVFSLLKRLRNHDFGVNPFTVISVIIDKDNAAELDGAMKSGADDVLTTPISPGNLMDRMEKVAYNRLPFIAMPDYIGPDRRKADQRTMNLPTFDVLNTLQDKIEGRPCSQLSIESNVADQMQSVRSAQLEGFSYKLGFLCKTILKGYEKRPPEEEVAKKLLSLRNSLHKAAAIATKCREPGLVRVCTSSTDKINGMSEHYLEPTDSELNLIKSLIKAYQMARENISGAETPH